MDKDELIFQEYKLYAEQKENFINRNFKTNKFYMIMFISIIFAMIFTGNVVFMSKISATLIFSIIGIFICALWWMNVDTYNMLIKIKYANVLEIIEEKLPVRPFTEEFNGIEEYRNKKMFMFSDIQKLIAIFGAIFFFAVFVSEFTPVIIKIFLKFSNLLSFGHGGI